ncbi:MAG: hypothetical protein IIV94_03070, partial [Clostridiales bacterium]|nr:hypothetical protein [Clostridiales bacterium]
IAVYKYDSGKCAVCDVEDPDARFATMSYFASELAIERRINEMLKSKTVPPPRDESDRIMKEVASDLGIIPDKSQLDALYLCMYSPISVITGGPGTGKTTIMAFLVNTSGGARSAAYLRRPQDVRQRNFQKHAEVKLRRFTDF